MNKPPVRLFGWLWTCRWVGNWLHAFRHWNRAAGHESGNTHREFDRRQWRFTPRSELAGKLVANHTEQTAGHDKKPPLLDRLDLRFIILLDCLQSLKGLELLTGLLRLAVFLVQLSQKIMDVAVLRSEFGALIRGCNSLL